MSSKTVKNCIALAIAALVVLSAGSVFAGDAFKIDPTHPTFGFAVSHVKVGVTRGEFTDYKGEIQFDRENPDAFKAWVIINANSVDSRLEARDNHLKSDHFFDVANYPTIVLRAKKITHIKNNRYELVGEITMRGVTKEITAPVTIKGPVKSPFGGEVVGMSGRVNIDRKDFGISWNDKMPDGGWVVGDSVMINVDIEAHRK